MFTYGISSFLNKTKKITRKKTKKRGKFIRETVSNRRKAVKAKKSSDAELSDDAVSAASLNRRFTLFYALTKWFVSKFCSLDAFSAWKKSYKSKNTKSVMSLFFCVNDSKKIYITSTSIWYECKWCTKITIDIFFIKAVDYTKFQTFKKLNTWPYHKVKDLLFRCANKEKRERKKEVWV